MRFRWFFLGYLLMFSIPVWEIKILPALGYALMLYAALRLSRYEPAFDKAKKVLYAALPIGVVLLGLEIYLTAMGEGALSAVKTVHTCVSWVDELAEALIMFFIYVGVRRMGDKADFPALVKHSSRNMSVMFVYLVTEIAVSVLYTVLPSAFDNFRIILLYPFIIGFIWRVLNLWMLFTCFLGIADTEEEKKREQADKAKEKAKRNRM
jgi:hypothetical protein